MLAEGPSFARGKKKIKKKKFEKNFDKKINKNKFDFFSL